MHLADTMKFSSLSSFVKTVAACVSTYISGTPGEYSTTKQQRGERYDFVRHETGPERLSRARVCKNTAQERKNARNESLGVLSLPLFFIIFVSVPFLISFSLVFLLTIRRRIASKPISQTETAIAIACSRESARSAISASIETISTVISTFSNAPRFAAVS